MPLQLGDRTAVLDGPITVEEAEPLAGWLRATPSPQVDLSGCTHLHTAALQALFASRARVSAPPADPFLRAWVVPLLTARAPSDTPHQPAAPDDKEDR